MSTTDIGSLRNARGEFARDRAAGSVNVSATVRAALLPFASLRLTVGLFAVSIFLVLAGTLAQRHADVWLVVRNYFRTWIAYIELRAFFPDSFGISEGVKFPFPGGWLVGTGLTINLFAAHLLRFKIAASGRRLLAGAALLAIGVASTYAVIYSGLDDTVESELSPDFCNTLWHALRAALGGLALSGAYALAVAHPKATESTHRWFWRLGVVFTAGLMLLTAFLFVNPDARLDPSGLRIMWQLIKATGASVVLWAGCWLIFAKRAGIVLLHLGVALMMSSELFTAQYAVESNMRIYEGETVSHAQDTRFCELVIVDRSDQKQDRTIIIPGSLVAEAASGYESDASIDHEALPFEIRVPQFLANSNVRLAQPGEEPDATLGQGQLRKATPVAATTGVDQEQTIDVPAALIELADAENGQKVGILLASPWLSMSRGPEAFRTEDGLYEIELRFRRIDKPYSVTLIDFRRELYEGTDTPKHYESVIRIQQPDRDVDMKLGTWMNNPVRYSGDTLYQSGFDPQFEQYTDLQVVSNKGWMIPYVACMIVATGMLAQFGSSLLRFVRKRDRQRRLSQEGLPDTDEDESLLKNWRRPVVFVPAAIVALSATYVLSRSMPPRQSAAEFHIHEFGQLPVAYGGRTQPMDSLARNTLRMISNRETFDDADDERQPAIRWLLDVVAHAGDWQDHRVFRIDNPEVLKMLDLKPRKRFRYSYAEAFGDDKTMAEFHRQTEAADRARRSGESLSLIQSKLLELYAKEQRFRALQFAFDTPPFEQLHNPQVQQAVQELIASLNNSPIAPRPVPPTSPEGSWRNLQEATIVALRESLAGRSLTERHGATSELIQLFAAYGSGDVQEFNKGVEEYRETVTRVAEEEAEYENELAAAGKRGGRKPAERLHMDRIAFEAFFNQLNPILLCKIFYIAAFVLAAGAFLGWAEGFNRSANWLLWATFALHSFALVCRIYISGRPPVTNLYSSAVFIGWGAVLFALLFEMIHRLGLGNVIGAAVGFPAMMIAQGLQSDGNGDTFGVMQAVLDTNFWLATHVVCISMGYVTTFLAGAFGLGYIVIGRIFGQLDNEHRRQLTNMTYGAVCFAMFFSFVGTVLGGLWADDSWGRFWGWDPKENGALIIVLWNALVLHARWGKMIGQRGLAVLAVFGNIVTAWSWFGVNQLSIGLHSYGFSEGLTLGLVLFAISQVVAMGAAALPDRTHSASPASA